MKGAIIGYIVVLLLFLSPFVSAANVFAGDSIQDAINGAEPGDTILIHAGTYVENLTIDKRLALIGYGADAVTIRPNNSSMNIIYVAADYVNISGVTLTGANSTDLGVGIYINHSNGIIISDTILFGNYVNILGKNVTQSNIIDNTILNGTYGIHMSFSNNNTLQNNNITNCEFYEICMVDESNNNTITDNIASDGAYTGIALAFDSNNNTITNNIVNTNRGYCGVLLAYGCEHNLISGNTIKSNEIYGGIVFYERNRNNTITGNRITNNSFYGIWTYNMSNDNLIYNNYFRNLDNAYDDGNNIWNVTTTSRQNIIYGQSIGGNYWGDYNGNDSDCDGFGDTQHNISYWTPPSSVDHLPLADPMCGDVDWNCYVSANDVVETYRKAVDPAYPISLWAADVDGNGYISANDVVNIYQKAVDPNHNLNCITITYKGGITHENKHKQHNRDTDRIAPCSNARISV